MSILSGKRVAVAGLDAGVASAIVAALDAADAFCRRIPDLDAVPGSAALGKYDIMVASASLAEPWFDKSRRRMERSLLVVGTAQELESHLAGLAGRDIDFMLDTAGEDEVRLRAERLLVSGAGRPNQVVGRPPLVVIADDDVTVSALVRQLLVSDGITCHSASDGPGALAMVREIRPDVLVLDVQMPGMTGFEVLSAVKSAAETAGTRVVLLTGAEQESDIMRGFALGAADYVVKPFNPIELLVRIRRFVRRT